MIRAAAARDIDGILTLLLAFAANSLLDYTAWTPPDLNAAKLKLLDLIQNHYLIVAEKDNALIGMIGAQRERDLWIRNCTRMRELFWWVDPQYRKSRLSAELYFRWEQDCARFIQDNQVQQVSLSTQPGSSNINLAKRGWKCVESHWIKE